MLSFPAACLLDLFDAQNKLVALCSGAVIAPGVVLTAGHCVSGFATWQLTSQVGGTADTSRYRYFGIGPEAAFTTTDWLTLRLRLHWEVGTRNAVQGNNAWLIANFRL